jgi:hypothetical protein
VVIDLKIGRFEAEFAGKMNLYVNAVNELIAHDEDRATVVAGPRWFGPLGPLIRAQTRWTHEQGPLMIVAATSSTWRLLS